MGPSYIISCNCMWIYEKFKYKKKKLFCPSSSHSLSPANWNIDEMARDEAAIWGHQFAAHMTTRWVGPGPWEAKHIRPRLLPSVFMKETFNSFKPLLLEMWFIDQQAALTLPRSWLEIQNLRPHPGLAESGRVCIFNKVLAGPCADWNLRSTDCLNCYVCLFLANPNSN